MQSECDECGVTFTRADNLKRHLNYHCSKLFISNLSDGSGRCNCHGSSVQRSVVDNGVNECSGNREYDIPSFDGDEFCDNKPLTQETLYRMMKQLGIPENRWNKLATKELKYRI